MLLDTHVFLWWHDTPFQLSKSARAAIVEGSNEIFISVVSAWELQIKSQLNKLTLPRGLSEIFDREMAENRISLLTVALPHVYEIQTLPLLHSDPFDRLLIAQSRAEGMTLITADKGFSRYDVPVCW
ncbi:MAG: type II toxin-antitoxin system VapC family toxin [Rhodothermales bacterium]